MFAFRSFSNWLLVTYRELCEHFFFFFVGNFRLHRLIAFNRRILAGHSVYVRIYTYNAQIGVFINDRRDEPGNWSANISARSVFLIFFAIPILDLLLRLVYGAIEERVQISPTTSGTRCICINIMRES